MRKSGALGLALLLFVTGCSSEPVLNSRPAAVPASVEFSGLWRLQDPDNAIPEAAASSEPLLPPRNRSGSRKNRIGHQPVRVFLEHGKNLKVTQTDFGLFIAYDRSIVEEYRFGENRLVTVGPIEAKRVSGWDGEVFVVETLDREGNLLVERWWLEPGDRLMRRIRLNDGDRNVLSLQQEFRRR